MINKEEDVQKVLEKLSKVLDTINEEKLTADELLIFLGGIVYVLKEKMDIDIDDSIEVIRKVALDMVGFEGGGISG